MVRRVPALLSVVPLEHGEVSDPEKTEIMVSVAGLLERFVSGGVFLRQIRTQVAALLAEVLHVLIHRGGVLWTIEGAGQNPEVLGSDAGEFENLFRQLRIILSKSLRVGHQLHERWSLYVLKCAISPNSSSLGPGKVSRFRDAN